ncbi:methyltransferase [Halocynthiibacter sp. C4]|uniref:class I SAM-dependent methyltransferase n=1 Tax=Halocynthiibacter sp. C4 TaxID=2992758 RepID=UPI00237B438C|nr:class I SAM-dependent methyltransferase [Halocynthiibacter sp. C4]MDE0590682.1 methyltransferase [Halocynthiibacter sp. C4]
MQNQRITLSLEGGGLSLPEEGQILVFNATPESDLDSLPKERVVAVQGFKPDYDALAGAGYSVVTAPEGTYAMAIVFLPRAKAEARAMIEAATRFCPDGLVVVDGQKTDGIDGIYKACRKVADCSSAFSKSHGKTFWFPAVRAFEDWAAPQDPTEVAPGFVTRPGVFSADGIDPGSKILADLLPEKLGADVADFGAGWGWLSAQVLTRESVKSLHLVEADHAALECVRENIADPRAEFHWADVTRYKSLPAFDTVVMNPPFHTSRAADPAIGKAFLAAAARFLKPRGHLWVVANRHLPYEADLNELYRNVEEVGGDNRFKVFHASQPAQKTRNI